MADQARTPSRNAVDNIKRWMHAKRISQQDLAERLTRIDGPPESGPESTKVWHRRTINRLLNHERRIDLNDLYSIALALDVTVGMILFPDAQSGSDSDLYQIGGLPPVGEREMIALLKRPAEVMSRPGIGVEGWDSDEPMYWVRKPSGITNALEGLQKAYQEAHPGVDIDDVRGGDVLLWAQEQGAEVAD